MVYFWGVNLSVAVAVGFIALFGLAVETGIVMVIYLNDAMQQLIAKKGNSKETITAKDLRESVIAGAAKRLGPKLMTVSVSLFALMPILWSSGVGSDVMKPIVLPMIGGVLTSAVHILLVTPLIFLMTKEYELRKFGKIDVLNAKTNEHEKSNFDLLYLYPSGCLFPNEYDTGQHIFQYCDYNNPQLKMYDAQDPFAGCYGSRCKKLGSATIKHRILDDSLQSQSLEKTE